MDVYIRNELTVDSDLTLDQAAQHSVKLILWLLDCQEQMQVGQPKHLELSHTDIECMFKATLYLFECHAQYGDKLVEAVLMQCIQAHAIIRRFYNNIETDRKQCIQELCANIINGTRNGHTHAPLLYQMHKAYAELQPEWSIIKDMDWSAMARNRDNNATLDAATAMELNVHTLQMRQLVRRICRLSTMQDIKIALARSMQLIRNCDLWLQLFREPKESLLYTRCYMLRQMICDMLNEGGTACSASVCFVHNIYNFVASDNCSGNLSRLYCWLMHLRFAGALGSYLQDYWQHQRVLQHLQLDDMQCSTMELPLEEMLYLTHLLLKPKSPCRSQFYAQLKSLPSPVLAQLTDLLNKVAYVYS
ncbi:PREDICTED: uncharacterized protein LOC108620200 [Drosophila arizonae]|uniref:Uncharacterized protein LOC108620200 n=1 Tax=Drosophila arizonae TaxID=7263 RepID=A0ABM1PZF2_DROAR|nr:PREDICTED: uncharacterized protein LOC108620200 [Drosophila arizonae]